MDNANENIVKLISQNAYEFRGCQSVHGGRFLLLNFGADDRDMIIPLPAERVVDLLFASRSIKLPETSITANLISLAAAQEDKLEIEIEVEGSKRLNLTLNFTDLMKGNLTNLL